MQAMMSLYAFQIFMEITVDNNSDCGCAKTICVIQLKADAEGLLAPNGGTASINHWQNITSFFVRQRQRQYRSSPRLFALRYVNVLQHTKSARSQ
jgi:hypothetical protein